MKTGELKSPEINALDTMFFIFNLGSISQAGRRGFDPRLPLQPSRTDASHRVRYGWQANEGCHNTRPGRLVGRSAKGAKADVAQLAERVLGKDEVSSSILDIGSRALIHDEDR